MSKASPVPGLLAGTMSVDDAVSVHLSNMSASERRRLLGRLTREDRKAHAAEVQSVRPRLGAWIRDARAKSGMSQLGLADALRLSRPAVASIEAGRQSCTVETLLSACFWLDADPHDALRFCASDEPIDALLRPKPGRHRRSRIGEQDGDVTFADGSGPEQPTDGGREP